MEKDLREKLLVKFKIINEGELFVSDFKYRFSDQNSKELIGFVGKSNEDTVNDIKTELEYIIRQYKKKYEEFCKDVIGPKEDEYINELRA